MNKIFRYSLFILCAIVLQSCVKDMQDDLNEGGWNHERSILGLKFKNQVGQAEISRIDDSTGEIMITLNVGSIPDLSKVELEKLELSYEGTASVNVGEVLDFSNLERKANISVTSPTDKSREYAIYATEFRETIEGTWSIDDLVVYGGTGPEYGGGAVLNMQEKSWCWYDDYAPKTEFDNILTFTVDEITDDGNTTGTCVNDAGADGKYADFIFNKDQNPETGVDLDLKHFYRQIPEGESRWIRNYALGTITFIDKDGKETTGVLENAGTYTVYSDQDRILNVTVANNAFSFNLNGVDDWTYLWQDYVKFAKKPRKYYIMVTKQD